MACGIARIARAGRALAAVMGMKALKAIKALKALVAPKESRGPREPRELKALGARRDGPWQWPGQCALCRRWCRGGTCGDCDALHPPDVHPRCALCALRLPPGAAVADAPDPRSLRCGACALRPPPLSRCVAAMDYAFPWDRLLLALKFGEQLEVAPLLAGRLSLALARAGILWYDIDIDRNNTALADNSSRDPVFGAGIGVSLGEHLNLRAEYEVVEIDGLEDPNAVWVTAAWRF